MVMLMAAGKADSEPTQLTQPKGINPKTGKPYEPVEVPVPKRSTFDRLLRRAETTPPSSGDQPRHEAS